MRGAMFADFGGLFGGEPRSDIFTNYTFSFEGALRYQFIKEYYPAAFLTLSNYIRQGRWRNDENVIFLHTGGASALFAYQSALGI